ERLARAAIATDPSDFAAATLLSEALRKRGHDGAFDCASRARYLGNDGQAPAAALLYLATGWREGSWRRTPPFEEAAGEAQAGPERRLLVRAEDRGFRALIRRLRHLLPRHRGDDWAALFDRLSYNFSSTPTWLAPVEKSESESARWQPLPVRPPPRT